MTARDENARSYYAAVHDGLTADRLQGASVSVYYVEVDDDYHASSSGAGVPGWAEVDSNIDAANFGNDDPANYSESEWVEMCMECFGVDGVPTTDDQD